MQPSVAMMRRPPRLNAARLIESSSQVSTSAARVSAASLEFLDGLTPLMTHFASAISVEDADAGKNDLRDNGFGAEFQERFSAFGIGPADRDLLLGEIFAVSDEAPVDLMDGLAAVAQRL